MNTKLVLASVVAALSGLTGLATTAKAGTDVHVNLNLGLPRGVVVVAPHRDYTPGYGYGVQENCPPPAPRGYWREVVVKTWVPARWIVTHDRRGREFRTLQEGYFAYRTDREWIAYAPTHDRDRGRYGYYGRG